MTKKRKVLLVLIGSAMFTSAARLSYSYIRFSRVEARFHRLKPGSSRQDVLKILGEPNYHDGPCNSGFHATLRGCAREFVYSNPLAPIVPEYYVVSFSKEDRLIDAIRLASQ